MATCDFSFDAILNALGRAFYFESLPPISTHLDPSPAQKPFYDITLFKTGLTCISKKFQLKTTLLQSILFIPFSCGRTPSLPSSLKVSCYQINYLETCMCHLSTYFHLHHLLPLLQAFKCSISSALALFVSSTLPHYSSCLKSVIED